MISDLYFLKKTKSEIVGSFFVYILFLREYPKVCVNLQTDVR